MRKLTNPEEYCEKIFNSVIYDSVYFCSYDIFDDYYSAKKELIRKYPKYGKLPVAKKRELYGIAVSMLNQTEDDLGENRKYFTITRSGNPECMASFVNNNTAFGNRWSTEVYMPYIEAFERCRSWGSANNAENGGYVFNDASALHCFDSQAHPLTDGSGVVTGYTWTRPSISDFCLSNDFYQPIMYYHYHPNNAPYSSPADDIAKEYAQSNYSGCNTFIILTDAGFYYY
ncbi:MAG: hypothetical protein J5732_09740 [Bacteroidaceae bacterium]|nr:hypothetical protein [Bacteroidaceae bacterium]